MKCSECGKTKAELKCTLCGEHYCISCGHINKMLCNCWYENTLINVKSRRKQKRIENVKRRTPVRVATIESQYIIGPYYEIYSDGSIKEKIRY